ncbi:MAG: hypothetical protein WCY89_05190 [Flavobacteriaceae bacterium]
MALHPYTKIVPVNKNLLSAERDKKRADDFLTTLLKSQYFKGQNYALF